ncbi:MAG: metallophosphoesterase family protein [Proteobacteria bacterium]|nr:metallophosphoesterase family protein [Pseudomonadota bacterium]
MHQGPGRSCPISYRYAPDAFSGAAELCADTLWIAGGLYGNPFALQALLEAYAAEPGSKALVFNGDFHWFDVDPADYARVDESVLGFHAMRGNVETEIAAPGDDTGCGCGYPDWVGDATVAHSNRIMERLRASAQSSGRDLRALSALPMHLLAEVGGERIGIVHGDAASLAGWNFSREALSSAGGLAQAAADFDRSGVRVFASSHTCLPVLRRIAGERALVNNGAAGMPNFRGERYGLATRVSLSPGRGTLYGMRCGALYVEGIALRYDYAAWERRFVAQRPAGSDAHRSYYDRIVNGPDYALRVAA